MFNMEALNARAEILSIIKSVSEEHGINNYYISNVKTNQKGEGYLGEIFMVTVKDKEKEKQLEMVVKAAFIDEKIREMVPIRKSFQNEIHFYTHILPEFIKLEREHEIKQSASFVPKCFKVSSKEQAEVLVLENLKSCDFEIFDKKLVLDDDHVKLIFKNYGVFHGYSFVLRDQKPEEYNKITKELFNVYEQFSQNKMFMDYLIDISKTVQTLFIPGEEDEIIKKYEKYAGQNIGKIFADVVTKNTDHSVILHGDCWSNNMMFKYENKMNSGNPVDMRLIDWQLSKVGSPVCDLSYCLYSGASKEVFDKLNEYLQIYYDSFSSHVQQLGSDPKQLFPFSVLKEHWRKYSRFGMIMALQILKMKLTYQEDIVDLTDNLQMEDFAEILSKQKFDKEGYNKRIRGLICHMSEVDAL